MRKNILEVPLVCLFCGKPRYAKRLCSKHYRLYRITGNPLGKTFPCQFPNCDNRIKNEDKKFCKEHLQRRTYKDNYRIPPIGNIPLKRKGGIKGDKNPRWNGGVFEYKNHYDMKKMRKMLIKERGHKCEDCGTEVKRLHAHHLDFSKSNHTSCNIKLLCPKCHTKIHLEIMKDLRIGRFNPGGWKDKKGNPVFRHRLIPLDRI